MLIATDKDIRPVVRLLARADRFNRLTKACPRRYRRAFYRRKDQALVQALKAGGGQFTVDSVTHGRQLMLGLTHVSGRRVHVPVHRMPGEIQLLLHRLAADAGHPYPLLRLRGTGPEPCLDSEQSGTNRVTIISTNSASRRPHGRYQR
ncbi:MAG TPA: hypothetical protein DCX07_13960 [Phycisphaerales bacterium]|nr:hypothetical protein [Phycisphaerales bacterium]